jgi:branched-chain amino acid transport system substrate-binding protein
MRSIGRALSLALLAAGLMSAPARAADPEPLRIGVCYDLSKAYTFATPQVSQAALDLAALVNMKGGIDGAPVEVIVRDHGNEPQRGVECYEQLKREGVFVFDTLSTPVSLAILPRAMKDQRILMQSLVGRGDAVDGTVFNWVYPVGPTYWGQAANDIAYIKQLHGGKLSDVKVGFVYFDYPFGQEPIEILKTLSEKEGFGLILYPVPLPGNDQAGVWSKVRRDKPDHIISWMLGGAHVVASKEMKRNGIPMERRPDSSAAPTSWAGRIFRSTRRSWPSFTTRAKAMARSKRRGTFSTIPVWQCIRSCSKRPVRRYRCMAIRSPPKPTRLGWRRSRSMTQTA